MTLSPVLSRPPFRVSGVPSRAPDVARHVPYVYDIVRRPFPLEAGVPELLFVLLNPSSAGGPDVPATLRRCDRIALSLGHASYRVAHLFAYPARQPRLLVAAALAGVDIVGPRNDEHLAAAVRGARRVVVAWGSFRGAAVRALVVPRAEVVVDGSRPLRCVRWSASPWRRTARRAIRCSSAPTPRRRCGALYGPPHGATVWPVPSANPRPACFPSRLWRLTFLRRHAWRPARLL